MVNDLMDALENKVHAVVDTIEVMRTEINDLKEERRILQDKLRELLVKMERIGAASSNGAAPSGGAASSGAAIPAGATVPQAASAAPQAPGSGASGSGF
ncbi:MAG: cell division protein ZapB [Candidatus Lambdaproteobacteria bacterium]|nr:cell division protein ZapB [Candidatus Lambdaproteobacteria bacterium]